jgi:hypothetical protein
MLTSSYFYEYFHLRQVQQNGRIRSAHSAVADAAALSEGGAVDDGAFSVEPRLQQTISTAIWFKSVPRSWLLMLLWAFFVATFGSRLSLKATMSKDITEFRRIR